ncbi:MAG: hypothetical protein RBT61_06290 [Candidatus Kapabacteria bacterium]|jgi:hypothetical protein|nr:hypothetical protein [Candidatus Kapabacteria bacterium]
MPTVNKYSYKEIQKFSQSRIAVFIMLIVVIPLFISTYMVINQEDAESSEIIVSSIIGIVTVSLILFLLFLTRLEVFLGTDAIEHRFFPFQIKFRKLLYTDIREYSSRKYSPILEYGGWGIRYAFKNGWAYNVSGNKGVQIVKNDGKRILFGTQNPDEFFLKLDTIMKKMKKVLND